MMGSQVREEFPEMEGSVSFGVGVEEQWEPEGQFEEVLLRAF